MPKTNIDDYTTDGWRAEVSWRAVDDQYEGHVQVASVNTGSTLELPGDLLDSGPNGEELRGEPEPFDGWRVTLNAAGIDRMIDALTKAKRAAFPNIKDPEVGDPVILHGKIVSIDDGIALVEVYRTWPIGMRVPVQCGALEHNDIDLSGAGSPEPAHA